MSDSSDRGDSNDRGEQGERGDRGESIFLEATALPTSAERTAYLDQACSEDSELRARVERLAARL